MNPPQRLFPAELVNGKTTKATVRPPTGVACACLVSCMADLWRVVVTRRHQQDDKHRKPLSSLPGLTSRVLVATAIASYPSMTSVKKGDRSNLQRGRMISYLSLEHMPVEVLRAPGGCSQRSAPLTRDNIVRAGRKACNDRQEYRLNASPLRSLARTCAV